MRAYIVLLKGDKVGTVYMTEEGLYYRFRCRCLLPDKQLYRLFAQSETQCVDLGILVPEGDGFCLEKQLPQKRLDVRNIQFSVRAIAGQSKRVFHPIRPDQPFPVLGELLKGHLEIRDGIYGLVFTDRPTKQNCRMLE